jgi:hypothetical protein
MKCDGNFGFFEAVDAPPGTFAQFVQRTVAANPSPISDSSKLTGTYVSAAGNTIQFDARGHAADSNSTGIVAINGNPPPKPNDWPLAGGDIITSSGDGRMTIRNPRLGVRLEFDFTDVHHPTRLVKRDGEP